MRLSSIHSIVLVVPVVLVACAEGADTDDEIGYTAADTEGESGESSGGSGSETGSDGMEAMDTDAADTTDTTDGSDTDNNMACQEFSTNVAPVPPDVMFLLDRSGSMLEVGFDLLDPDKTRWEALYEAVEAVVDEGADATVAFGAKTFSTQGEGECGVSADPDVAIKLDNATLLLDTIPGPKAQVNGGTPTNLGLEMTMDYMTEYVGIGGSKFVILITDGSIMCTNDVDESLADAVALLENSYLDFSITTYVVGIAPSEPEQAEQLDSMAIAGGAPKMGLGGEDYYRADDAQQLADALAEVVANSYATSCLIDLVDPPFFPDLTKVVVGDQTFDLVDDCGTQDGFVYTDDMYEYIELCGAACDLLGVAQTAEVQFYCNPS
jgi:hypothetical protein